MHSDYKLWRTGAIIVWLVVLEEEADHQIEVECHLIEAVQGHQIEAECHPIEVCLQGTCHLVAVLQIEEEWAVHHKVVHLQEMHHQADNHRANQALVICSETKTHSAGEQRDRDILILYRYKLSKTVLKFGYGTI